jgi:hypothetical protein
LPEAFDVFLSYNRKDQDLARRLRDELETRGVEVWMDEKSLTKGQAWILEIEKAIAAAPAAIIAMGPSGIGEKWQDPSH